jgi:hypothetical protein
MIVTIVEIPHPEFHLFPVEITSEQNVTFATFIPALEQMNILTVEGFQTIANVTRYLSVKIIDGLIEGLEAS